MKIILKTPIGGLNSPIWIVVYSEDDTILSSRHIPSLRLWATYLEKMVEIIECDEPTEHFLRQMATQAQHDTSGRGEEAHE